MTPAERARHAALVRWGKENPFAARMAAVREARKQRKAKGKAAAKPKPGTGGGAAKPKAPKVTPEQRKAEREQEQTATRRANEQKVAEQAGLGENVSEALLEFASPDEVIALSPKMQDELVKRGMVEIGADGTPRLSSAGRAYVDAARSGDVSKARDALSRGGDRVKQAADQATAKQERETARAARQAEREKRAAEREQAKAEKEKQKQAKGGGGGGKGKDDAKDKEKTAKEQARQERTERVQALQLGRLERGGKLSETQLADLEAEGLITIDRDGVPSLTPDGKKRLSKRPAPRGDELTVSAIKQTAQERAMFANMGGGGGGSGGSGGKPSGGTGGLWKKGSDGKRVPSRAQAKKLLSSPNVTRRTLRAAIEDAKPQAGKTPKFDLSTSDWREIAKTHFNRGTPSSIAKAKLIADNLRGASGLRFISDGDLTGHQANRFNRKATEIDMSDFAPILDDLTATLDELTEVGQEYDAIKAGRRNSAADQAIVQAIYDRAEELCELAETLGAETGEADDESEMGEMPGMAGKALDYEQVAQKVREAWYRAPMQMPSYDDRPYVVTVRDDSVIVNQGGTFYLVSYTQQDGAISFAQRGDWQEVKPDYVPVSSSATKSVDPFYAVKALDDDRIGAYAVRFGSADEPDISMMRDYFTKATDYWLDKWSTRPMLYHHALDPQTADDPVVGTWTKATVDDVGIWLEGELAKAHKYRGAIQQMITKGALALSSDSAPHLVKRKAQPNGTNEVTRWPLLAASLTPTPAEPRLLPASQIKAAYKAIGLDVTIDDSPEAHDTESRERSAGTKAAADDRARRLSLHARIVALQE